MPVSLGRELRDVLLQKGVPTHFVCFPDENHWVLKAENSPVWHREVKHLLDEHALGQPKGASASAAGG